MVLSKAHIVGALAASLGAAAQNYPMRAIRPLDGVFKA
jgi:hypothetical protein